MQREEDIKEALEGLGLDDPERRIYLCLLATGFTKVGLLSKKTKISRSKCYEVLNSLLEKGIVTTAITRGVKHYDAIPPERLTSLLEERKNLLETIIPDLVKLRKSMRVRPKVEFYEGTEGIKTILDDCLNSSTSKTEILTLGCAKVFDDLRMYFPEFIKERVRRGIKVRVLQEKTGIIESLVEKDEEEFREIRFLPWRYRINTMTQIYGRKIAFLTFKKDNYIGVVIENEDIVATHRLMFNSIWDLAIKTGKKKLKSGKNYLAAMQALLDKQRFIVIDDRGNYSEEDIVEVVKKIRGLKSENLKLCFECHLGFKITDNYFLKHILKETGKQYIIQPSFIDERERSGGEIFYPTSIYAGNKSERIHQNSLQYVSQIPFKTKAINKNHVLDTYRKLSFHAFNEIRQFFETIEDKELTTLGDFLTKLQLYLLKKQLNGLDNITIQEHVSHRFNQATQATDHTPEDHRQHHILYIPLHQLSTERDPELLANFINRFAQARREKKMGKKPYYIIISLEPVIYFNP